MSSSDSLGCNGDKGDNGGVGDADLLEAFALGAAEISDVHESSENQKRIHLIKRKIRLQKQ